MVTPRFRQIGGRTGGGGAALQLAGVLMLGVGIGIELAMKAHVGFLAITVGSALFAIGTKLKGR